MTTNLHTLKNTLSISRSPRPLTARPIPMLKTWNLSSLWATVCIRVTEMFMCICLLITLRNEIFYIQTLNFVQSQVDPILSALNRQFETRPDPNYQLDCYQPLRDLFTKYEKVIRPEYSFVRNFGKSSNQPKFEEVKEMILDPQRPSLRVMSR